MIRINLANSKIAKPQQVLFFDGDVNYTPAELQKQGLLRLVILIIIPLALWYYEDQTLPEYAKKKNELSATLEGHRNFNARQARAVQEIKRVKEDEAKLQTRIATLERISKDRYREIKIMDLVQQVIPEKVWLTRFEMNNGKVLLSGYAMSDFEISGFLEVLTKSVYFTEVILQNSSEQTFDSLTIRKFDIQASTERGGQ